MTHLSAPQEIYDQIIDEVAHQNYENNEPTLFETLKFCSLISKSFNSRATWYLFPSLELIVDKYAQQRAARLVKILQRTNVQSLELILDEHSSLVPRIAHGSRVGIFKTLRHIGNRMLNRKNNIHNILDILGHTPSLHFGLGAQTGFLKWNSRDDEVCPNLKLLQIITHSSLKSLRLSKIECLPQSIIKNAFFYQGLTELKLQNICHVRQENQKDDLPETQSFVSALESLELHQMSYTWLLSLVHTSTLSYGAESNTFPSMPRLQTLSVSIPKSSPSEMYSLWKIMVCGARSLVTLDLQIGQLSELQMDPICLKRFPSLRHLRFTSSNNQAVTGPNVRFLIDLLNSVTQPLLLQSVNINFYIRCVSPDAIILPLALYPVWSELDNALSNQMLVDLRAVTCNIRPFCVHYEPRYSIRREGSSPVYPKRLLPLMTSSRSIELKLNLMPMTSPHHLFNE